MKKSIIYFGIALLTITNVITALAQQSFVKGDSLTQTASSNVSLVGNAQSNRSIERRNSNNDGKPTAIDPEAIVATTYQKTMEEIIAENNQIIESTISTEQFVEDNQINIAIEGNPVCSEKAIEEIIIQDSQIIESPVLNAIQPIALGKSKKS